MKKYNLNKLIVLVSGLVMLIASSCTKILDINEDPNNSPSSTPQLALPAAQVGLAMAIGDWNYRGAIWAQYWTGGQGVSTDNIEKYNMTGTDPETSWSRAYSLTLTDLKFLVTGDQPIYAGIGKILTAYTYQMLVDLFGAVPFSEALKGQPSDGGIVAPKFDSEQVVYAALIPMIDEAIANLHESGTLIQSPGSEDLIYGGDLDSWEAFANTLKLKILVRQGEAKKAEALALLTSGAAFIDASNPATIQFTETTKNTNPLYNRFDGGGLGMYFLATAASIDTLTNFFGAGNPDPRVDALYKIPTNAGFPFHRGVLSGDVNVLPQYLLTAGETAEQGRAKYSSVGAAVYGISIPEYFISNWESKFLQAETLIRNGQDATSLVNDGIQESFDVLGVSGDAPAYITALNFDASSSIDNQLNVLGIQKWISMNGLQMIEGWIETERFDRPGNLIFTGADVDGVSNTVFTNPTQNVLGTRVFPTSFVYPTQEVANNPNTPAGRVVTDKRFWDN